MGQRVSLLVFFFLFILFSFFSSRIIGSLSMLCSLNLFAFVQFPGKPLFGTLIALLHKGRPVRISLLLVGYLE